MRRYADIIASAFAGDDRIHVERACVAGDVQRLPGKLRTLAHHASVVRNGRRLAKQSDAHLFHVIDGSHGYLARVLRHYKTVVTVHDVIPKLQSMGKFETASPGFLSRKIINFSLSGLPFADHLIFDSQSTLNDVAGLGISNRGKHSILFPPLEDQFSIRKIDTTSTRPADLSVPFVFHIGNNGFYKNRKGVIEVFARVAAEIPHRLILAGPPPTLEHLDRVRQLQLTERVAFESYPSDERVHLLYRHADVLMFPSFYEGFGWPPIEAMALGCPVVCSNGGSLGEVVGDAALVSGVGDVEAMAGNLLRLLSDSDLSSTMRAKGAEHASAFGIGEFSDTLRQIYLDVVG
ncbi:D-inositol 3-phosphate glycosyltransferase [Stieleria varia]|uniref:D-inositol 3-phosphate glycosyltransferase n=2 Tax=Stieleria varia TaxID=2528005 RepID=A0A5C6B609_9BACT|nr:D-inositol 3-phosphate glycosyltransferase [Stieleria varia]